MNQTSMTNEQLCALAQKGDAHAADLLLEHNSGFIRKTASEIFLKSNLAESDLSIESNDLEQEGGIGLRNSFGCAGGGYNDSRYDQLYSEADSTGELS